MHDLLILALRYGGGFAILASLTILGLAHATIQPKLRPHSYRSIRERRGLKRALEQINSGAAIVIVFGALFVWWSFA
ncbi:hypothetical protein CPT_Seuss119 [Caulobacter phage Seuss]|uniref:Uncharacterized protein n=1 Tax=Caulobacter phage Seuss TaxID=1675601 RepID=A0A0K1LNC5_9CAUD|nr:hypothetical protein HOR08_gp002 [Caulobacter phage Seuss]YP_009785629.1 hypothetical protein HOR08_gp119 [Caulobacter phage Seuss]AKU43528.1 hypothetical protein CPT_Seuss2 [Caulobacter phage Seuss]AKU43645.1 hypothetical protein CPT_Seuss119 [Caulobacter phage Seuss]